MMSPVRPTAMCMVIHPALVFTAASTVLDGLLFTHNVGLLAVRSTISFEKKIITGKMKTWKVNFPPQTILSRTHLTFFMISLYLVILFTFDILLVTFWD